MPLHWDSGWLFSVDKKNAKNPYDSRLLNLARKLFLNGCLKKDHCLHEYQNILEIERDLNGIVRVTKES